MSVKLAPRSQPEPELATTTATTSVTRKQRRSKVWPQQLAEVEQRPACIGKLPNAPWLDELDCAGFELEARRAKTLCERLTRMNEQFKLSRRLFSQDFAEVCFVGGYITALIGSLVAISGIFTRNQARTRLYMEGFGCGMVILGVLVVFISLRMRANKSSELAQLRRLLHRSRQHNKNRHNLILNNQLAMAHTNVATCLVPNGLAGAVATPDLVVSLSPAQTPTTPSRLTPTVLLDHQPIMFDEEQQQQQQQQQQGSASEDAAAGHLAEPIAEGHNVALPSGTHFEPAKYDESESAAAAVARLSVSTGLPTPISDEDDDEEEDLSLADARDQLSLWTPCNNQLDAWSYPNDLHDAAAIEAALSIVLTVATLAGFRPDGAEMRLEVGANADRHEHFCCLHHTVQFAEGSRRFLTGLIIGTLLARNGAQPYSSPSGYSAPSSYPQQQQQPLFIIIPSGSGKSGYKHQPSIYPAPPYSRGSDPYDSFGAESQPLPEHVHRAAGRRLSPYFRRRSASLLKRKRPHSGGATRLPQPTSLTQVLRPSLATQTAAASTLDPAHSSSLLVPNGAESGRQLNDNNSGLSGLARAPSSLLLAGSSTKALKHGLTIKTSNMANRIRSRHRNLWTKRGQTQTSKPALRRSRSGEDLGGLLEDGSSRFIGENENENEDELDGGPLVADAGGSQTLSDRVASTPAAVAAVSPVAATVAKSAPEELDNANRWRETTSSPSKRQAGDRANGDQQSALAGGDNDEVRHPAPDSARKLKLDRREQ